MIPARFTPFLFGLLLSAQMSLIISGVTTFRAVGLKEGFVELWLTAWLASWCIAFPCVLVVAPITRKLVAVLTRERES